MKDETKKTTSVRVTDEDRELIAKHYGGIQPFFDDALVLLKKLENEKLLIFK